MLKIEMEGMNGRVIGGDWREDDGWGGGRKGGVFSRKREVDRGQGDVDSKRNRMEEADTEIRMLDHCIFCLRKTGNATAGDGLDLEAVPRATVNPSMESNLLGTFNKIWPYLRHKFEESDNLLTFVERNARENDEIPVFTQLPTMCFFCADKLKSVDKLLISLWTQMRRLSNAIQESRAGGQYSWRATEFEKILRESTLEQESITATLQLLFGEITQKAGENTANQTDISTTTPEPPQPTNSASCSSVLNLNDEKPGNFYLSHHAPDLYQPSADIMNDHEDNLDGCENEDVYDPDYIKSEDYASTSSEKESEQDSEYEGPPSRASKTSSLQRRKRTENAPGKQEKVRLKYDLVKKMVDKETGVVSYACLVDGCGKSYGVRGNARQHQRQVHQINKINVDLSVDCNICRKTFANNRNLAEHMRVMHEDIRKYDRRLVRCDLCGYQTPAKDLHKHVRKHVGEEYLLKCPNVRCPQVFTQTLSLYHHLQICRYEVPSSVNLPAKNNYTCEVCDYSTSHALTFRTHLLRNHENATKNFTCPISGCEQSFTLKQSVVLHLPHHDFCSWIASQRCSICSEEIKVNKMEEHIKNKHQVPEAIKCKQCSFLFSTREQLIEHLFDHRFSDLQCDICADGVKYSKHAHLQDHYFSVHKIGVKFSCEQCESVFWKKGELTKHLKDKHMRKTSASLSEAQKKFRCEECDVEYKAEKTLKEHNILSHGAEPFSCSFCTETFTRKNPLIIHLRNHRDVITGLPEKFKCDVEGRGKIFNKKPTLIRHQKVDHLGVKHVCELCRKSYSDTRSLRAHKNIVHLGLRPYICDQCGESFIEGKGLKRHKLIHTGERPFPCEICGQRFRQKHSLKVHLERHEKKGADFKPNGPMKNVRKRVEKKIKTT